MPLYEMVMVCRMGEQQQITSLLRTVSKTILQEGGVVRGFTNLGDRILTRNRQTEDGVYHGVGRWMQVQFYASPQVRAEAEKIARLSQETLQVFALKVKEDDYFQRMMGSVNAELSPFKDEETRDSVFLREMLVLKETPSEGAGRDGSSEGAGKEEAERAGGGGGET